MNREWKGQGIRHPRPSPQETDHCEIRDEPIEDPFYTYCANHPKRRSGRDPVPIGPIFAGEASDSFSYERTIWKPSPDTEVIRRHLLDLISDSDRTAEADSYPAYPSVVQTAVWQLAEFREGRAVETLQRLAEEMPEEWASTVSEALKRIGEHDS